MGGFGSGRTNGRATTGSCLSLDVTQLYRKKALKLGRQCEWHWLNENDEKKAAVGIRTYDGYIALTYRYTPYRGVPYDVKEYVGVTWTDCNYGGNRPWFECPECFTRVRKLYLMNGHFYCRTCHNLTYKTCLASGNILDESIAKVVRLKRKMGATGSVNSMSPVPFKPKGMHWKTYNRLYKELIQAENVLNGQFSARVQAIVGNAKFA